MKSATVTESVPYPLKQPSPAQWLYALRLIEQGNVWWSIAKKLKGIDGYSILGPKPGDVYAEDGPDDETEDLEEATDTSPDITMPAADDNILKVYINDDLCKARSIVAFRARELKRDKKINDTWVSRGMIIIKDKFNKIHSVSALSQFEQFKWIYDVSSRPDVVLVPSVMTVIYMCISL